MSADDIDDLLRSAGVTFADGFDPYEAGANLGMTKQKVRMGLAIALGINYSKAAALAGYTGKGSGGRSTASKTANSKSMQRFLKLVDEARGGSIKDLPLTEEEEERLLARYARGAGGNSVAVRALIESIEQRRAKRATEQPMNVKERLGIFAGRSVECAIYADVLARVHNVEDFDAANHLPEADREAFFSKRAAIQAILNVRPLAGAERADARA